MREEWYPASAFSERKLLGYHAPELEGPTWAVWVARQLGVGVVMRYREYPTALKLKTHVLKSDVPIRFRFRFRLRRAWDRRRMGAPMRSLVDALSREIEHAMVHGDTKEMR